MHGKTPASEASTARPPAVRELIVIARSEAGLRARTTGPISLSGADVRPLTALLQSAGARLVPVFGASEEQIQLKTDVVFGAPIGEASDASTLPLSLYYRVDAPDGSLDALAASLRELPLVEAAYVKPPAEPAQALRDLPEPRPMEVLSRTPDFSSRQGYLEPAPGGIDARFAWTLPGGRGAGVRIIDIEGAWRFTHEDLSQNQGGVAGGTENAELHWRNHGTAVMGVIGGDNNTLGITGICPDANTRGISIFGPGDSPGLGSAGAIVRAAELLGPGDIILIELHRPGPLAQGIGQQGFIALEWWPDDYDAIRYAVSRGVLVVEAAGNGSQNLDDAAYDRRPPGFPSSWSNPFRRGPRDSGAILVGAGAPPPGTHGQNHHGPDRSRLAFSNFGTAVDAQGWGEEVTTCGYGDLQGGPSEELWYTDQFNGTSSASPIIVGALGCIQGVRRARGLAMLIPAEARALLRSTGSPQQAAPGRPTSQRIGNRPDLRQLLPIIPLPGKGPWFNPARSGAGIDIQHLSADTLLLTWFTYTSSGVPIWYIGSLTAETGVWAGALLEVSWNGTSSSNRTIGTAKLLVSDGQWRFQWTLGALSGEELIEPVVFGDGSMTVDMSGNWFNAQEPGWGIFFATRGKVHVVTLAIFQGSRPTWLQGSVNTKETSFNVFLRHLTGLGLCPECAGPTSVTPRVAGLLTLNGRAGVPNTVTASLQVSLPGGGVWNRPPFTLTRLTGP